MPASELMLDAAQRAALWTRLIAIVEDYAENVDKGPVTPELNPAKIRALLDPLDFSHAMDPVEALDFAARELRRFQTHSPHPRYYGLYNPAPATMSIAADTLVAAFNPQLAAWSHSPFAIEVEQHLVRAFGERFGYTETDGTFASGGAEANHTALLVALTRAFPEVAQRGVRSLAGQPVLYISSEAHHTFLKAAKLCGIGIDAVRILEADPATLRMDAGMLERQIAADRAAGALPFLIVGTAGTTNAGVIDPLAEIAQVAERERIWFHADAAWGGAAVLVPELRPLLAGIERADSITFDAHKWLSVPMGAGLFLTRHAGILDSTFRTPAAYMPREAAGLDVIDPHLRTMQWSRRFIGLKVFLSLLVSGWEGYARTIRHQTRMGDLLRKRLQETGWRIVNQTALPVVCFVDGQGNCDSERIVSDLISSGEAWISTATLAGSRVLRACITNYRTGVEDVEALVAGLNQARSKLNKPTTSR